VKPILLATDGSPSAAEATLEAIQLAGELGAPLVAIAVPHVVVPSYGYFGHTEIVSLLMTAENEHVVTVLADVKDAAEAAGVTCDTIAGEGGVVEEICRAARDRKARLIVIGAHGWSSLRRIVSGSVSAGVIHQAPCPVMVVRGGSELLADQPVMVADPIRTPANAPHLV
jgi:nucleotide-binding universal stress UspA family protein